MHRSTLAADYQDVSRPIAILSDERPPGAHQPQHSHRRGQLIYALSGVLLVMTQGASYIIPSNRALWVPAGVGHESYVRGHASLRTLYFSDDVDAELPTACRVIEVSPLLRELIIAAALAPIEYEVNGRDGRVMRLILDEVVVSRPVRLDVPMPRHPRLLKVCTEILRNPAQDDDLDHWACAAGMGRRTFTRTFMREANCTFAAWRQTVRLREALSLLASGQSVTEAAFAVGYASSSAFTAMFRKAFGVPPTLYLAVSPADARAQPRFSAGAPRAFGPAPTPPPAAGISPT